jgi:hypothetical protein
MTMPRSSSLQAVLDQQARSAPPPPAPREPRPPQKPAAVAENVRPAKFHRPSRDGRKLIAGHFDPKVAKQLKLLAVEGDTTVQALLEEALDLLFVKKGRDRVSGV